MFIIVCYDVPADRTQLFKKLLGRYLMHLQNSLFVGNMPPSGHAKMLAELKKIFSEKDQVWIMVAANRNNVQAGVLALDGRKGVVLTRESASEQDAEVL